MFRKIAVAIAALAVTAAVAAPMKVGVKWQGKPDASQVAGKRSSWG